MSNNRRQNRFECEILLNKVEDGHTNVCLATDLSLGGMRLERLAEPYCSKSDQVQLQFLLPGDEDPIWVAGTKVHERDGSLGVRFTNISHTHFVKLRNWIKCKNLDLGLPQFTA